MEQKLFGCFARKEFKLLNEMGLVRKLVIKRDLAESGVELILFDVFERIVEPVDTVDRIWVESGGLLYFSLYLPRWQTLLRIKIFQISFFDKVGGA